MKRLFDKIYFSSELLSDKVLVGGDEQNLLKFLIADTISATEIKEVQLKLQVPSTVRGDSPEVLLDWETFTQDTDNINIFEKEVILTFVEEHTDITALIKITDIDDNIYYNEYTNFVGKVF